MVEMTIKDLLEGYRSKSFSPVEVVKRYLQRIKDYDPILRTFITVNEEEALLQAEIAEKRIMSSQKLAILHGVPISFKDCIETRGLRTTSGSLVDQEYIPTANAAVVERIYDAGGINLGKANMHEFGMGITSNNRIYGAVRNPWDTRLIAGGSSGGSAAAVAAHLCPGSIGSDTSGSIRIPASFCGVVGLKPTYGLVDSEGITPLSWTLDHVGPIARNVEDLTLIMEAIALRPYRQSCSTDIRGLRIGVPVNYFNERVDPEITTLYLNALKEWERMGAVLIELDVPVPDDMMRIARTFGTSEAGCVHKERIATTPMERYGDDAKATFERSRTITAHAYIDAMKRREHLTHEWNRIFAEADVVVTPTVPASPAEIGEEEIMVGGVSESVSECMVRFTQLFNITGHPALTIPGGMTKRSLPTGLQLAAAHHREDLLFRCAYAYEQSMLSGFYEKRNNIPLI